MSDAIKHECGLHFSIKKPLEFYKENTVQLSMAFKKMYLFLEKSSITEDKDGAGLLP